MLKLSIYQLPTLNIFYSKFSALVYLQPCHCAFYLCIFHLDYVSTHTLFIPDLAPIAPVKNRFSNLTKAQEGQDRPRKDKMNRHWGEALSEGCHERKKAQTVVPSREKINNNRNLARATTKSKSETQTVSNGCVSWGARDKGFEECPNVGDLVEWVG